MCHRSGLVLMAGFIWLVSMALPVPSAWGQTVSDEALTWRAQTPQWQWAPRQLEDAKKVAGALAKPSRVVFVMNYLAEREAAELSERFGFDAWVTPVVSNNSYLNHFDEKALEARLQQPVDLIIITASLPGRDLSPAAHQAINKAVAAGVPVLIFSHRTNLAKEWPLWKELPAKGSLKDALLSRFPVDRPAKIVGDVQVYEQGKTRVVIATSFSPAFVFFDAFEPRYLDEAQNPWSMETGYAIAGWIAQAAMDPTSLAGPPIWRWQSDVQGRLNEPVHLLPDAAADNKADENTDASKPVNEASSHRVAQHVAWDIHDAYGKLIANGTVTQAAIEKGITFTPDVSGEMLFRWRLQTSSNLVDWGTQRFEVQSPMQLSKVDLGQATSLGFIPAAKPAAADRTAGWLRDITWQTTGDTAVATDRVVAQVYDPEGRLVNQSQAPATTGKLTLTLPRNEFVSYELRLLLIRSEQVLDETRQWFTLPLSREDDLKSFRVILWSSEKGRPSERWRFSLMRKMGIDTLATIGRSIGVNEQASQAGLRLLPTNVFVPPNRRTDMAKYSLEKKQTDLDEFAKVVSPYSPLGYSLADEPDGGTDMLAWLADAKRIIHRHDPGAIAGYCGVWLKNAMDVPGFFKHVPVAEMYSPTHLYTPNIWMGTERDLMRSFAQPETLLTSWTHYVTSRDNEAYARTVPWVWLFEGFKGVSYFCSAYGNFTTLDPDLTPARDMRWAMEELHDIRQGAGSQFIAMKRSTGQVRVLFVQDSGQTQSWAMSLNRMNVPWCYTTLDEIKEDTQARFVIVPDVLSLSDAQIGELEQLVARGVSLLAISPLGVLDEHDRLAQSDRLSGLFGVRREIGDESSPDDAAAEAIAKAKKLLTKQLDTRAGVLVDVRLAIGPWQDSPLSIEGKSTGEYQLVALGDSDSANKTASPAPTADVSAAIPYTALGNRELSSNLQLPPEVRDLATSPAGVWKRHAKAATLLLTFTPDIQGAMAMLPALLREAKVSPSYAKVLIKGEPVDTVYLYPFASAADDGPIEMLGVAADYWRIKPSLVMTDRDSVDYQMHGAAQWSPLPVTIKLPELRHVYDARLGQYLGLRDTVDLPVTPGQPALLALLPYTIDALTLKAPPALESGQSFTADIAMAISNQHSNAGTAAAGAQAQGHMVHVTFVPPEGVEYPGRSMDVMIHQGQAKWQDTMPLNAPHGQWTLTVRDFMSGKQAEQKINVLPDAKQFTLAGAPMLLPEAGPRWDRTLDDRPNATWVAYRDPGEQAEQDAQVKVSVQKLRRARKYISSDHRGHEYLTGGFRLGNPAIMYDMFYNVCNDTKAHGSDDPTQAWAPYLPGLGIRRPQPHIWYYNGYIVIAINGKNVSSYRLSDMTAVPRTDKMGQVDVTWETPYGKLILSSAMNTTQTGMYQQLTIEPASPLEQVSVSFRSYPKGFSSTGRPFYTIDPEHQSWVVIGDSVNDPAFFPQARGPGALLVDTTQWTKVDFKRLTLTRETTEDPSKETVHLNWVLWLFPGIANAQAVDTLRNESPDYQKQMREVFNPRHLKKQEQQ